MSRYIDAEWLLNFFEPYPDDYHTPLGTLRACVDDAPSIDIVRCKECRWYKKWKTIGRDDGYCEYARNTQDGLQYINVNPDDFCSYGERRE